MLSTPPRIAFYTHDTFGLGHIRRCLHIIEKLSLELPESAILLITGSPALEFFKDLPKNVDIIKIPTIVKSGAPTSAPSHLPIGLTELIHLRRELIKTALVSFRPDLFVVDNFPLGSSEELFDALVALKQMGTKLVLGLRDVVDTPDVVLKDWTKKGYFQIIERYYDRVLIYGAQHIFDAVKEYEFSKNLEQKSSFTGYVTHVPKRKTEKEIEKEFGISTPFILATGGGGGDAFPLFSTLIEMSDKLKDTSLVIVLGPLMGKEDRKSLWEMAQGKKSVILKDFLPSLSSYLWKAELVIGMSGYNLASEIVHEKVKALFVPRTWRFGEHKKRNSSREELEQRFRAEMLEKAGLATVLPTEELTSDALLKCIERVREKKQGEIPFSMEGRNLAARYLLEQIGR